MHSKKFELMWYLRTSTILMHSKKDWINCLCRMISFGNKRPKTFWYREGNLNTKFFHAATTSRRKVNRIKDIENSHGTVCRNEEELQVIVRDNFSHMFTKLPSNRVAVISKVPTATTEEDNYSLTTAFTLDEFYSTIFSMQDDKCSRPDDFNLGFYHRF